MVDVSETLEERAPIWGIPQVMEYTRLSRRQVERLTESGVFPVVPTGISRNRYVPAVIVERWAEHLGVEER